MKVEELRKKQRDYDAKYYIDHREKLLMRKKEYYQENKCKILAKQRAARIKKKECNNKDVVNLCDDAFLINKLYRNYMKSAAKRMLVFDIDVNQFDNLVNQPCYYCGKMGLPYNGIDRLNNNRGYIFDNCVSCCTQCNYAKKTYSSHEYISKCISVATKWMDEPPEPGPEPPKPEPPKLSKEPPLQTIQGALDEYKVNMKKKKQEVSSRTKTKIIDDNDDDVSFKIT